MSTSRGIFCLCKQKTVLTNRCRDNLPNRLRRLIINWVCYFPEFVSFKTFRETSFERIWAKLYCFGNTCWHPCGEKLGPFWGVGSRPHFGSLLELFFGIFGAPGLPRRNPFGSLFGSCCHPEAPWGWKLKILGGVWLQSLFLKRFCLIFGRVLGSENIDFAWER